MSMQPHPGGLDRRAPTARAHLPVLHNIVHLLYGIVGLALSRRPRAARMYLLIGGLVYALLWIYGLIVEEDSMANFVPLNAADDWLHFVLAVTMIGLSFLPRPAETTAAEAPAEGEPLTSPDRDGAPGRTVETAAPGRRGRRSVARTLGTERG